MEDTITISTKEYEFLKLNLNRTKANKLSILAEKTFTQNWDSKEDEIWDTY